MSNLANKLLDCTWKQIGNLCTCHISKGVCTTSLDQKCVKIQNRERMVYCCTLQSKKGFVDWILFIALCYRKIFADTQIFKRKKKPTTNTSFLSDWLTMEFNLMKNISVGDKVGQKSKHNLFHISQFQFLKLFSSVKQISIINKYLSVSHRKVLIEIV